MNTSFKEYVNAKLIQENAVLEKLAQAIYVNASRHPFYAALVADRRKFKIFLGLLPEILSSMSPAQRDRLVTSKQDFARVIYAMMNLMVR